MALGRIGFAWAAVAAWLALWALGERQWSRGHAAALAGEALLLTLFGALWFGSLGAGAWWLVFVLLGALREWPLRSVRGAARVARIVVAGGLLAWIFPP